MEGSENCLDAAAAREELHTGKVVEEAGLEREQKKR